MWLLVNCGKCKGWVGGLWCFLGNVLNIRLVCGVFVVMWCNSLLFDVNVVCFSWC